MTLAPLRPRSIEFEPVIVPVVGFIHRMTRPDPVAEFVSGMVTCEPIVLLIHEIGLLTEPPEIVRLVSVVVLDDQTM